MAFLSKKLRRHAPQTTSLFSPFYTCSRLTALHCAAQSTRRLDRRLHLASGLLLRGLIGASGRGRARQRLQWWREV
jgi:hypothetical protein